MIRQAVIMRAIAETFDTPAHQLRSPCQTRRIAKARFAFMFLARKSKHSFGEIGVYLNRDHTTIIHGCRRAREIIETDDAYALQVYRAWEMIEAAHTEDVERLWAIRRELLHAGAEEHEAWPRTERM